MAGDGQGRWGLPGQPKAISDMNHFLDIHKTDAADLRAIIDQARITKDARQGRPKAALDDEQPLKDRMVAAEEEGEGDEDEEPAPVVDDKAEAIDGIQPKRSDEQLCSSCFLLVRANAPSCPVGDDDCPVFS